MTTTTTKTNPLFSLGQVVMTPGAIIALEANGQEAGPFLGRHWCGDWGEVCPEDAHENQLSLEHGYRIMSVYRLKDSTKLWIITEADRSVTTLLLPEEY